MIASFSIALFPESFLIDFFLTEQPSFVKFFVMMFSSRTNLN